MSSNRRGNAGNAMSSDAVKSRAGRQLAAAICVIAGMALSGCGLSDGPGQLMVAPGAFDAYHCNDLVNLWNSLNKRELDLRGYMSRASQGGGGTVIGTRAYGTDYQTVLT